MSCVCVYFLYVLFYVSDWLQVLTKPHYTFVVRQLSGNGKNDAENKQNNAGLFYFIYLYVLLLLLPLLRRLVKKREKAKKKIHSKRINIFSSFHSYISINFRNVSFFLCAAAVAISNSIVTISSILVAFVAAASIVFHFFFHFYLTECLMWIGMDSFFSVCFLFICSRLSCQWPLFISLSSVVPAHTNTLSAKRTHTHILLLSDLIFGIETFVCSEIDIVVTEETDWHRYVCIHCRTAPRISNYTINKHISIYFGMTESF